MCRWGRCFLNYMRHSMIMTHTNTINILREAALNDLEAYIYKVKNKLSEDEDALKEVSKLTSIPYQVFN